MSIALTLIPYGRYGLYPFALLATWAHEMGHGLTALLSGGTFDKLVLYQNLGGTAFSASPGWAQPLVSAGGLLGPAIAGGFVIVLSARPRTARWVLGGLAIALLLSLVFWIRNLFGLASIAGVAVVLGALALKGPTMVRVFLAQMIGIQLCLGSISSFDYMFTKEFVRDGKTISSDTQAIASVLLLPYWFWGTLIAALSLLILTVAFYLAWVRPIVKARRKAKAAQSTAPAV